MSVPVFRAVAIALYLILVFLAYGVALVLVDSEHCAATQSCTGGVNVAVEGLAVVWLGLSISVTIAGWKGFLPGARRLVAGESNSLVS